MAVIGIVPHKTRFEWTRNKDGTFNLTHKEWVDKETYEKAIEATKAFSETFAEKLDIPMKISTDDEERSVTLNFKNINGPGLFGAFIAETAVQFLKTERDYLAAIATIAKLSPVGDLLAHVSTSFTEIIEEIQQSDNLTPEENKQLSKLLNKALG